MKKNIITIITVFLVFVLIFSSLSCNAAETAIIDKNSPKEQIKQVQQALKDLGYYNMTIDGILGSGTTNAVKAFQKDRKLFADGIIGDKTLSALGITLKGRTSSKYSSSELNLLARAVQSQAKNEPFAGKVAIAAVILNRVKHPDFPSSVAGVIFQPKAFDFIYKAEFDFMPSDTTLNAARDALNGFDPSLGSIYFYETKKEKSREMKEKQTVTVIGRFTFTQ